MRLAAGDIVEIETDTGFAYVQVSHTHTVYPEIVRVLDWHGGQAVLGDLTGAGIQATAMVPLGAMMETGRVRGRLMGAGVLGPESRDFPLFKIPILDKKDGIRGEVAYWWIWDGEGMVCTAEPDMDMDRIPLRETLGAEGFLRLVGDCVPADRQTVPGADRQRG